MKKYESLKYNWLLIIIDWAGRELKNLSGESLGT